MDVPVWQRINEEILEEIENPNFVLVCVAEDTGGEAVAGPIFDAANPTYVQVIDEDHVISSTFDFVNVPSAVWIDEEGRIVRIDEGTYSQVHEISAGDEKFVFGNDVYAAALKDWVKKGAKSKHVQSRSTVAGHMRNHSFEQLKAGAAFRLGNFFRSHGHNDKADEYWALARSLNPDSINFIRQHLTLSEEGSAGETFRALASSYERDGKDYYRPLDITL